MKLAYCYWLLVTLGGRAALAQTHPKKKSSSKAVVAQRQVLNSQTVHWDGHPPDWPGLDLSSEPGDSSRVYAYVEHMPLLNGQSATVASITAIEQYLVVSPAAPAGRVFVTFEVKNDGRVSHPHIVKGLRADLDSAVVVAVRQLPRFTPGKQGGQVVTVSVTVPITIPAKKQP